MAEPDKRRWSQHVTETSEALSLEPEVFKNDDPASIARSLSNSAEHSDRRKSGPYRSAMSMLTFYINRAGRNLPERRANPGKGKERVAPALWQEAALNFVRWPLATMAASRKARGQ